MKKYVNIIAIALVAVLALSLTSCGGESDSPNVGKSSFEHKYTLRTTGVISVDYQGTSGGMENVFVNGIDTKTSSYHSMSENKTIKLSAGQSNNTTLSAKNTYQFGSSITFRVLKLKDEDGQEIKNEPSITFTWEAWKDGKKVDDYSETVKLNKEDDSYLKSFSTK